MFKNKQPNLYNSWVCKTIIKEGQYNLNTWRLTLYPVDIDCILIPSILRIKEHTR